jgi:dihydrofolate reductase
MSKMILCTDENNGIGYQNTIPWHSSADFKHFKEETLGKTVVMGFNTWKSLPRKPLPGRTNIVLLSRDYTEREEVDSHHSVLFMPEDSLGKIMRHTDCVIIGGAKLYAKVLPHVDTVVLSKIQGTYECDTFFDIHSNSNVNLELQLVKTLEDGTIVEYWYNNKENIIWI